MMTARQKVATVAATALALLALLLSWPAGAPAPASAVSGGAAPRAAGAATAAVGPAATPESERGETAPREAFATPGAAGRGDLVVRLLHGDDRSPAAGVMVTAFRKHEIPRNSSAPSVDSKRRRTDADGIARFPSMRAGRTGLIADRGHWYEKAYVLAGKETEVEFVMPVGVTITGTVVSALGVPVADAEVELESAVVATTDPQGRFTVRGASPHYAIGARALGHGASKAQQLMAHDGKAEVRIELGAAGGIVEGAVFDPDGKPLADVRVDIGRYDAGRSWVGDAPPRPARARTDAEGHFRAIGIPVGEQQLRARSGGLVPWSGSCVVTAAAPAVVQVVFARGNLLRGTLRDADGRPFGDVLVSVTSATAGGTEWEEVIAPDGTFTIAGLPDGEVEVKVDAEGKGEAHARVPMLPGGAVTTCELTLVCGFVAKGKVRDEAGHALPNVNVRWQPSPNGTGYTFTDEQGAFAIANVPAGKLTISLDGDGINDAQLKDLDPRVGELDLRVQRRAPKTVYIAGVVLDHEGRPAVARAWASGGGSRDIIDRNTDEAGYFEIGPVSPGQWQVVVETRSYPRLMFERRQLEASTRWDVGTVRLALGGDVRVEVVDGVAEGAWFSIYDEKQRGYGLRVERGKGTSELLANGRYRLLVGGRTQAAQSIPFEIRSGETTKLDVRLRAGVRQRFEITLTGQVESAWCSLRILRNGERVAGTSAKREEGRPSTAEACLEPGDYTVTARFGEREAAATFTVGEREGEPVRVTVSPPAK